MRGGGCLGVCADAKAVTQNSRHARRAFFVSWEVYAGAQKPWRERAGDAVQTADKLPTRCEIMVYHTQCCDDSLLGSIELTSKHKLSDVAQLVRDELDVTALTGLFRGTDGDSLLVPLHKAQMDKLAIPLFGHGNHHIVVVEAEEDDGSTW